MKGLARALAIVATLAAARTASAHATGLSRLTARVGDRDVRVEAVFARAELKTAFPRDVLGADLARDVTAQIAVTSQAGPCALGVFDAGGDEADGVSVRATWTCPAPPTSCVVDVPLLASLSTGHRMLADVREGNEVLGAEVLDAEHTRLDVGAARAHGGVARFLRFVQMGVLHILTGADHLLFLFALVLVGGRTRALVGVVTAFTIAHSVTLAIATLGLWSPPPRVVEPLIALSIAYVGVENLFVKDAARRWRITLPFGLVHGFGFAGALREIALPRAEVPRALAGFNLGVELGQLAVLAVVLPLLAWARTRGVLTPPRVRALSVAVAGVGLAWFVARVVG